MRYLPSRNQVEKFFEPSVNAIVEGIKNIAAGTDPANTVRIFRFSLVSGKPLDRFLVCVPCRRFCRKSVVIPGSRA